MSQGSARAITAGEAFIRFGMDREQLQKDLREAHRDLRKWSKSLRNIGVSMALTGGGMLGAVGALVPTIADAETAWRRFNLIFDKGARNMEKRLRSISKEFGIGTTELASQASTFGAIFAEVKDIAGDEAFANVIDQVMRRTLDLSALAGVSMDEAADKMKSAFTSTGEAVDQYGLNLRIANLELEAQAQGMTKAVRDMTELEKQMLKLSLINKQFARTGVSFGKMQNTINTQWSRMKSNIKEVVVAAGWALRRVLVPMMKWANMMLRVMRPLAAVMSPFIVAFGAVGGLIGAGGIGLVALSFALNQIAGAIGVIGNMFAKAWIFINILRFAGPLVTDLAGRFFTLARSIFSLSTVIRVGLVGAVMAAIMAAWSAYKLVMRALSDTAIRRAPDSISPWLRFVQDYIQPGTAKFGGPLRGAYDYFRGRGMFADSGAGAAAALAAGRPKVTGGRGTLFGATGQSLALSMAGGGAAERTAAASEGLAGLIKNVISGKDSLSVRVSS